MGIVYPDVNTAAEARRGVARAKFPPIGKRSAAGAYSMFDFRPVPVDQTVSALNDASDAWGQVSDGASKADRGDYLAGERAVKKAEAEVKQALDGLSQAS